jgi:hypothetical protein
MKTEEIVGFFRLDFTATLKHLFVYLLNMFTFAIPQKGDLKERRCTNDDSY